MTNCDPRIEDFMKAVETEEIRSSREVKALVSRVRNCFETEDIYVDSDCMTAHTGECPEHPDGRISCVCWGEVPEKTARLPGKLPVW